MVQTTACNEVFYQKSSKRPLIGKRFWGNVALRYKNVNL